MTPKESGSAGVHVYAQQLEARGDVDAAVQHYLKANNPGEAAKVLSRAQRHIDAAQVLLDGYRISIDAADRLDPALHPVMSAAGRLLAAGKRYADAGRLFWAVGEYANAAAMYRTSREWRQAALAYGHAGDWSAAAFSLAQLSDWHGAILALSHVEPSHASYAQACHTALGWASALPAWPPEAEAWVRPYLSQCTAAEDLAMARSLGLIAAAVAQPALPSTAVIAKREGTMELDGGRSPAASSVESLFRPGTTVADRYELEQLLGRGGMACVFRARDLELHEVLALKVFTTDVGNDEVFSNFREEIRVTRQLTHKNLIKVYDMGQHQGYRFMSMEFLEGRDLASFLVQSVPLVKSLDWLLQACAGLQAAHDQGVVHRDVKPENLFLTATDTLKVTDFGIARRASAGLRAAEGMMAGTPAYVSPEQVQAFNDVGPSADIYSLGVVAFRLLTGQLPFDSADLGTLLRMHLSARPPEVLELNPTVPPAVGKTVARMLEKSPERRQRSCREVAAELEPVRAQLSLVEW